jgi:nitrite reductase (NADH) small subunit/3-phenylpropionate/trans-cinnamate dioxygenase ferredoxin subunit
MADFVTLARAGDVPEGQGRTFCAGECCIALFLVDGTFYALDDFCPHMGASLGESDLRGDRVVCNRHMWAFRLADGSSPDTPSLRAQTYEVRVVGDEIQVRLPDGECRGEERAAGRENAE